MKKNKGKYAKQTKNILLWERKQAFDNLTKGFLIGVATMAVGLVAGLIIVSLMYG